MQDVGSDVIFGSNTGEDNIYLEGKSPRSDAEALAARTTGLGVGIGKLEPTRHHFVRIVELSAFQIECGLGIDHDRDACSPHENIAPPRFSGEFHLVTQAIAAASSDRDSQEFPLLFPDNQGGDLVPRRRGQAHEIFITFADTLGKGQDWSGDGHSNSYCPVRDFIKRRATTTALAKLRGLALPCPARPKAVP